MQPSSTNLPEWRKVLWMRQPYPDNYVSPEKFLTEMRKNVEVEMYEFWWLVKTTTLSVTAHIASILVFLAFFYYLHKDWISVGTLIASSSAITIGIYLGWIARIWMMREAPVPFQRSPPMAPWRTRGKLMDSLEKRKMAGKQAGKSAILFMMVLLGLTPILKTLTEDTSSDSIWILAFLALSLNALSFDYSCETIRGQDSLSLNAAIFASVLLASRLPSKAHVFGLMSMAVIWFALVPLSLRYLRLNLPRWHVLMVWILITGAGLSLATIDGFFGILYVVLLGTVSIFCPALFVLLQKYKNQINGPWDEAVPNLPKA